MNINSYSLFYIYTEWNAYRHSSFQCTPKPKCTGSWVIILIGGSEMRPSTNSVHELLQRVNCYHGIEVDGAMDMWEYLIEFSCQFKHKRWLYF